MHEAGEHRVQQGVLSIDIVGVSREMFFEKWDRVEFPPIGDVNRGEAAKDVRVSGTGCRDPFRNVVGTRAIAEA